MKSPDDKIRFDELSAGLALGDLSPEEVLEFNALLDHLGEDPDPTLEFLATTLEVDAVAHSQEALPTHLRNRLERLANELAGPAPGNIIQPEVSGWKRLALHPLTGWAAAAAVLVSSLFLTNRQTSINPALAEKRLRAQAADLLERKFEGLGDFKLASGTVVWRDQAQQGYMTLTGIPVNDPKKAQYQLWVVDPTRDADAPVDGGVFDIPTDGSPVVVPIVAKLSLTKPQAFVITLEQPGGVVKSKQEKVVALAKG
jgi:Anti-sigma-K factor rskA